jgi:hypothetical protein
VFDYSNNYDRIIQHMSGLKWSDGSQYQRSKRVPPRATMAAADLENEYAAELLSPEARALSTEETWTVDESGSYFPTIPYSFSSHWTKPSNKREESYNKMAERDMMGQTSRNPYIDDSSSYADNISNTFLTPVSTSQDKIKGVDPYE